MNKDLDEINKEKLLSIYNTIPDTKKQNFVEAIEYLSQCFMINVRK